MRREQVMTMLLMMMMMMLMMLMLLLVSVLTPLLQASRPSKAWTM